MMADAWCCPPAKATKFKNEINAMWAFSDLNASNWVELFNKGF
jgi:hypothetical protein